MHDVQGNRRLTTIVSTLALLPLLAGVGLTLLRLRSHIQLHIFFGLWVMPPLLLKLGSAGWRFALYYGGEPHYRRAGPPAWGPRLVAPVVVVSTVVLFVSGIGLWLVGPGADYGGWFEWHRDSFIVWFFATAAHVLLHLEEIPAQVLEEVRLPLPGRPGRAGLLFAALLVGVVLALVLTPLPTGWLD